MDADRINSIPEFLAVVAKYTDESLSASLRTK
jgi:hypothetical protein